MLYVHTYCTKPMYVLYVPTAVGTADHICIYLLIVRTSFTYCKYLMTYVHK